MCACIYIYIYIHVFVYILLSMCAYHHALFVAVLFQSPPDVPPSLQDSSKGGAVETGCSDLYDVIY